MFFFFFFFFFVIGVKLIATIRKQDKSLAKITFQGDKPISNYFIVRLFSKNKNKKQTNKNKTKKKQTIFCI